MNRAFTLAFLATALTFGACAAGDTLEDIDMSDAVEVSFDDGKTDSASSCKWRCKKCPPNQLCIQVCEQMGNCPTACTMIASCLVGYEWDTATCSCKPTPGNGGGGDTSCPDPVNCLVDPCAVSSCDGDLTATCEADYCHGGCDAIWTSADGTPAQCGVTQ